MCWVAVGPANRLRDFVVLPDVSTDLAGEVGHRRKNATRQEVSLALHTTLGVVAVVGGLLLDGIAFLWIRHLLQGAA